MQAAGIEVPAEYNGVEQQPMDGVSMMYSFDNADAPNRKERQYYEMFGNRAIWVDGWKAATLDADRMPWDVNVVLPFEEDEWELYHVADDFSESTNLAEENPEKLAELVAIFDEEAWKYNVYPLYDDMIRRIGAQQDRLFGDQTEYIYYAPGAIRIAEKASAPVKNRSHTIDATIDLTGDEDGVIVAVGGMTDGFTLFIQDNRLVYDYNYLDGVHYILRSASLPRGSTDLRFDFTRTAPFAGTGELYVNGELVDEVEMPAMHISTYSLAETFDVGRDTGTQVSDLYAGVFEFIGALDRVTVNLSDEEAAPANVPGNFR
jgi:arylsulfatase